MNDLKLLRVHHLYIEIHMFMDMGKYHRLRGSPVLGCFQQFSVRSDPCGGFGAEAPTFPLASKNLNNSSKGPIALHSFGHEIRVPVAFNGFHT